MNTQAMEGLLYLWTRPIKSNKGVYNPIKSNIVARRMFFMLKPQARNALNLNFITCVTVASLSYLRSMKLLFRLLSPHF